MLQHHHRRHHHKSQSGSDNRVWLALAGFVLLAAIAVAGYYFYNKQAAAGPDAEAGANLSEPGGALPGPTGERENAVTRCSLELTYLLSAYKVPTLQIHQRQVQARRRAAASTKLPQ